MEKRVMSIDFEYDFDSDSSTEGINFVPKLLDFFDANDITATFFVVGKLAEPFEDQIKEISKKHEIASHSYSHVYLNKLNEQQLNNEIKLSKESLNKIGIKCKGFRAPFLITHPNLGQALIKHGFEYDSSIGSFFPGRFINLFSHKKPYRASATLTKKGNGIIEFPIPNFTFFGYPPSALSYYRLFHPFSKLFKIPYLIYLHPYEFLEKGDRINMPIIIKQLSSRNSGRKAWDLFEDIISIEDTRWVSCRDYIKDNFDYKD